jgi:hypothetical protein
MPAASKRKFEGTLKWQKGSVFLSLAGTWFVSDI